MPERLDFAALLEVADDGQVRSQVIRRIGERFSVWCASPQTVMLLDCAAGDAQERAWPQALDLVQRKLSASELLFVYFAPPPNNGGAVLGIGAHDQVVTYTMSVPLAREEAKPDQFESLLAGFYDAVTDGGQRCVAAAGWELEFDERLRSVSDVLRSIDDISSLIDWLICPSSDIDRQDKFTVIWETRTTLLLGRQH